MGMNETPKGERIHIALFGKRNAGKSSVINGITNQNMAIVSDIKGTTTDPVYKAMELLPLGPVMMIDTPGLDDEGVLGAMRMKKTREVLNKSDAAILVVDIGEGFSEFEENLLEEIKERKIPCIIALNKVDLLYGEGENIKKETEERTQLATVLVSAHTKEGMEELKNQLIHSLPKEEETFRIVGDLLNPSDFVVLVVPIDKAAPKGRLILPQQQTIRDILESDATAVVTKEYELRETLENLGRKPKLVITDSQVFSKVSADTPKDIWLTSFSILFARYKGDLEEMVKGAKAVDTLEDGDKILMAEGCTHHRQCDDIGTVKLPRWMLQYTGKKLIFEHVSGNEFPERASQYKMVVHCGGCTLNRREMKHRIGTAVRENVPVVNYGILIAYLQGILKRSVEPFEHISLLLEE